MTVSPSARRLVVVLFLVGATLFAFWPILGHDFVDYDDDIYVTRNPHVPSGPTPENLHWALTTFAGANWHPLTWLSHMLDCGLYGLNPAGHHASSLLLHVANSVLLFLLLSRMTGSLWRSAFVAALFALHPLHVESVAWVAERKDVLSTLFWILTTWAYVRYAESPGLWRYVLVLLTLTMGLAAKPMLVTLPLVLVLLDYWPLGRFQRITEDLGSKRAAWVLVREKLPLMALAAACGILTLVAQKKGEALGTVAAYPWSARIANAVVSYESYLRKTFWPSDLAVIYPHPGTAIPLWRTVGALLVLAGLSGLAIRARRRLPYVAVGWLWYLGTLLPMIGLVQAGQQARADRYTYVPLIGVFLIVAWGVPEALARLDHPAVRRSQALLLSVLAGGSVLALTAVTRSQVAHWRDTLTLFEHALDVTPNNYLAHNSLGYALYRRGRTQEGADHYAEALRINPDFAAAHLNLGFALYQEGRIEEARGHYAQALRIQPDSPLALCNLGIVLSQAGKLTDAIDHFSRALAIDPNYVDAHNNLGAALFRLGRLDLAMERFSAALSLEPASAEAHFNQGTVLAAQGRVSEAMDSFGKALALKPDYAEAHANLAAVLYVRGDYAEAWKEAHRSQELGYSPPPGLLRKLAERMAEP